MTALYYVLWAYGIGAAATAVMLLWSLIMRTEKVLGLVRKKVGPAMESLRELFGESGFKAVLAIVMIFSLVYQTLIWPHTLWLAVTRKDEEPPKK